MGCSYRLEDRLPLNIHVVGTPRWIEECVPREFHNRLVVVNNKIRDLAPVKKTLYQMEVIAADSESSGVLEDDGLDPISDSSEIILMQLGNKKHSYLIEPALIPEFKSLLEDMRTRLILQNAVHDFRFLRKKYGIYMTRVFCTMLGQQILTAGKLGYHVNLQELSRIYAPHILLSKEIRSEFIRWKPPFTVQQLEYAARDIYVLPDIARSQHRQFVALNLVETAQLEFACIPAFAEMNLVGVCFDEDYHRQSREYWASEVERLNAQALSLWNAELRKQGKLETGLFGEVERRFDVSSNQQKEAALNEIGLPVKDAEYETLIRLPHPIGKVLADWSEAWKNHSTYGQKLADRRHRVDNRIHPSFDQMGAGEKSQGERDRTPSTSTGRSSSDFQQLPRPSIITVPASPEQDRLVRAAFAAEIRAIQFAQQQKRAA